MEEYRRNRYTVLKIDAREKAVPVMTAGRKNTKGRNYTV